MSIALPVPNLEEIRRELESPHQSVLLVVQSIIPFGASGDIRATWRGLLEDGIHSLEALGAKKIVRCCTDITARRVQRHTI